MDLDDDHNDDYLDENFSPNSERMSGVTSGEVLTRVELDLAYSSEKVLNLELLLMQVASRVNDYEAVYMEDKGILTEDFEDKGISTEDFAKASEFDLLSGILNSEVKELDDFMASLQIEIVDVRQSLSQNNHFDESSAEIEVKFHDAEESLKQSQERVADIRMQSEKFERTLTFGEHETYEETESGHLSSMSAKWKLQTVEQQRHVLQMFEKSLARELDLEKKLSDSRYNEEELKMKLHYAEQEAYYMEESMETILERMLEAENATELLLGISKELTGKFQIIQFNLNGSIYREREMESKLQESMTKLSAEESALAKLKSSCAELNNLLVLQENSLKTDLNEAKGKCILTSSEAPTLREKVTALEEQLRESESQLQQAKVHVEASQEQKNLLHSNLSESRNVIEGLRDNMLKTESRAESAEAKCTQLTRTNMELSEELGFFRNDGADKASMLERKLKESDTQLEHAKASVEAIEEQQNMLYLALNDMENLIADLKGKVSKAESRAESAESKCNLLTDTNLELNEELGFLRGRLECLETSLHQADDAKVATAKDIGIRSQIIADLVTKLALERDRLQLQMSALSKRNKMLEEKCMKTKDDFPSPMNPKVMNAGNETSSLESSEEVPGEISATSFQVEKSATTVPNHETCVVRAVSADDDSSSAISKLESVRTIEATQLNSKYLLMAFIVVLVSLVIFLIQQENH